MTVLVLWSTDPADPMPDPLAPEDDGLGVFANCSGVLVALSEVSPGKPVFAWDAPVVISDVRSPREGLSFSPKFGEFSGVSAS